MKLLIELMEKEDEVNEDLVKFLKDNCSKYINNHKHDISFLIRGISSESISDEFHVADTGFIFETQEDRPPRDTRKILHDMINDFFERKIWIKTKIRARRVLLL